MEQLDLYRPDKPSCAETAMKDQVDTILNVVIPDGEYKGLSYIQAITLAKAKQAIEDPKSVSFGDIAKITADRKQKVEVSAGSGLLELFGQFNAPAEEVIDPKSEGDE